MASHTYRGSGTSNPRLFQQRPYAYTLFDVPLQQLSPKCDAIPSPSGPLRLHLT